MKKFILIVAVAMLAGCGGGSGSSTSDAPEAQAQKTSVADGSWGSYYTADNGFQTPTGVLTLRNGTANHLTWIGNANISKSGTFSVSGNTLAIHYTSNTWSQSGQTLSQIGQNPSSSSTINEAHLYTFTISGSTLTLTDSAGNIKTFTR